MNVILEYRLMPWYCDVCNTTLRGASWPDEPFYRRFRNPSTSKLWRRHASVPSEVPVAIWKRFLNNRFCQCQIDKGGEMVDKRVVFVLGPPRSGTSAISSMLVKLGINFGHAESFI